MKKLWAVVLVLGFVTLSACGALQSAPESEAETTIATPFNAPLSAVMQYRIKRDFNRSATVIIDHYFGSYNDSVALMIRNYDSNFTMATWQQEIAGFVFHYNDGQSITVWSNGSFYSLPKAYAQGLLTSQNINEIHRRHQQAFPFMY